MFRCLHRFHQRGDIFPYDVQQRVPFDFVGEVSPHDIRGVRRNFGKRTAYGVMHIVDDYIACLLYTSDAADD